MRKHYLVRHHLPSSERIGLMANKKKPNFKPYGNKKSGNKGGGFGQALGDLFKPSKKQTPRTHHDGQKGNRGNGGGKKK